MTVILPDAKLFYASVPKVACTSIKHMFFEYENGFEFRPYTANGRRHHIHNAAYKGLIREKFPERQIADFHRVAVLRDPVSRFLSAYGNRVIFHKELSRTKAGAKLRELGLEPMPSLELFIERLDDYRKAHYSIFHHTRPMVDFLGDDPAYFARLYRMDELDLFVRDMSERLATTLTLPRKQTGGPKFRAEDLTAAQTDIIRRHFARDYEVFGDLL